MLSNYKAAEFHNLLYLMVEDASARRNIVSLIRASKAAASGLPTDGTWSDEECLLWQFFDSLKPNGVDPALETPHEEIEQLKNLYNIPHNQY